MSASSTASAYNQNINKRLAQLVYKTFVYQKILHFTKFLYYENLALYGTQPKVAMSLVRAEQ